MNQTATVSHDIAQQFILLTQELKNLSSAAVTTTENINPLLRELKVMLQYNAKMLETSAKIQGRILDELKELRTDLKETRADMEERFVALEDEIRLGADDGSLG